MAPTTKINDGRIAVARRLAQSVPAALCALTALSALLTPCRAAGQGADLLLDRYRFDQAPDLQVDLPEELDEISGLAVSPAGRLFAHQDERAFVYELEVATGRVLSRFRLGRNGVRGDFEGIAIAGDRFFLVQSRGDLYEFSEGEPDARVEYDEPRVRFGNRCEVEGLAFDPAANALLLACKTPRRRDLRGQLSVFAYSLDRNALDEAPRVLMPLDRIPGLEDEELSPSGIEVDRETGHMLLVASRQRLLLELSREGEVLATQALPEEFHRQPEGIALGSDGTLFVSDEAAGETPTLSAYVPRTEVR